MLKRSGSKTIVVDGQPYRYVLSVVGTATDRQVRLAMTAQHAEMNGSRLRVTGIQVRRVPEAESKFYRGRTVESPVQPRHVEQMIRQGIICGWQPLVAGKAFVLGLEEN